MLNQIPLIYQAVCLMGLAYLIGSIPFGYLAGRLKGIDLREHGSKNIGATNASRVLGKKYFYIILICDAAKGFAVTVLAGKILFASNENVISVQWIYMLWLMVAFFSIAGHNWPCWLKFKGGKGVATSLGVVLAIYPYYTYPGLIALLCWVLLVRISGYVSLGSIFAAGMFLISYLLGIIIIPEWSIKEQWPLLAFASVMAGVLTIRHRSNIRRLGKGTENKFSLISNHRSK